MRWSIIPGILATPLSLNMARDNACQGHNKSSGLGFIRKNWRRCTGSSSSNCRLLRCIYSSALGFTFYTDFIIKQQKVHTAVLNFGSCCWVRLLVFIKAVALDEAGPGGTRVLWAYFLLRLHLLVLVVRDLRKLGLIVAVHYIDDDDLRIDRCMRVI